MSYISRHQSELEDFNCSLPLDSYECVYCDFSTYEKVRNLNHTCGFGGYDGDEFSFGRCSRCNRGSFSFGWRYFHEMKCSASTNKLRIITYSREKSNVLTKLVQCDQCDYKTDKQTELNDHKQLRHIRFEIKDWIQCNDCDYKTTKMYHLNYHVRNKHDPIKSQKWHECDQCQYKTKIKAYLRNHKNETHVRHRNFQCDKCTYSTNRNGNLRSHKYRNHSASTPSQKWYQCDKCAYKSNRPQNLEVHTRRKHTSFELQKLFECDQCQYKTKIKEDYKKHQNNRHKTNVKMEK